MKILFLPEYGAAVGGGHVMRCLTLAGELSRRGAQCAFAVAPEARPVMAAFAPEAAIVDDSWPSDVAVLDGYGYTTDHERGFAAKGLKVAAFDDVRRQHQ